MTIPNSGSKIKVPPIEPGRLVRGIDPRDMEPYWMAVINVIPRTKSVCGVKLFDIKDNRCTHVLECYVCEEDTKQIPPISGRVNFFEGIITVPETHLTGITNFKIGNNAFKNILNGIIHVLYQQFKIEDDGHFRLLHPMLQIDGLSMMADGLFDKMMEATKKKQESPVPESNDPDDADDKVAADSSGNPYMDRYRKSVLSFTDTKALIDWLFETYREFTNKAGTKLDILGLYDYLTMGDVNAPAYDSDNIKIKTSGLRLTKNEILTISKMESADQSTIKETLNRKFSKKTCGLIHTAVKEIVVKKFGIIPKKD